MPTVNVNGYELFYADDDFSDRWKPRETIIMQHFVFGNHMLFKPWVPTLAREFRVIRMDRRGNGYSQKPPVGYQYNLEDLISDIVGTLDALGLERIHYVGTSFGGVLGVAFAIAHPERVKSLVLCSTPLRINEYMQNSFAREGYPDGAAAVTGMGTWAWAYSGYIRDHPADRSIDDSLREFLMTEMLCMLPAHVIASLIRLVSRTDFNITSMLSNVPVPTLLLSPTTSPATNLDEQAMMLETIPNCEQVIIEGPSNKIYHERPDQCAKATLEFVRRHTG